MAKLPSMLVIGAFLTISVGMPHWARAQRCNCSATQPYSVSVSQTADITQSWGLTNLTPAVRGSQLNQTRTNQPFGYSFLNIPFLCSPILRVVARPLDNSPNNSGNDSISLQVRGSSYRWSSRLSALVPSNTWVTAQVNNWTTLTLPLSGLPGGADLSMDLITTRLDVYIQDDTAVRSLTLTGQSCPGPGVSRTRCCGDGAIAWANASNLFGIGSDGNIKRAYWDGGGAAQWIQTAGSSPVVPGSFVSLSDTTVLLVNDAGQVIKVSPTGSSVIPNTSRIHPCSLVVTDRGIYGVRKADGNVVLMNPGTGQVQSVAHWGGPHRPIETSLIEIGDGRVAGVTQHGFPWNVWFDQNGKLQWATIGEIGTVQVP